MAEPFHAHVYYAAGERAAAEALRARFLGWTEGPAPTRLDYVGALADGPIGPHPQPQFELHFAAPARAAVVEAIAASGLTALVHPLSDDDLADHTTNAEWIGEPLVLDLTALDPPGENRGLARLVERDF